METEDAFSTLASDGRDWAVPSIHGEAGRLKAINEAMFKGFRPTDKLVYLGNMIGHGPWVRETIDELLLMRRRLMSEKGVDPKDVVFLRGGQEEMWQKLLVLQMAADPAGVFKWMVGHGIEATLNAYGSSAAEGLDAAEHSVIKLTRWTNMLRDRLRENDGHTTFFSSLKRAARLQNNALLFVNADINSKVPLSEQADTFWWGGGDFDDIEEPYSGFAMVVRGYDPKRRGIQFTAYTATLDNLCGRGGVLEAVCFGADGTIQERFEA